MSVRVALVGTGTIAGIHAEALRGLGDRVDLVAGVDVDGALARSFCREHGIPHAGTDLARVLQATRPDLVHVCTPPGAHLDAARTALAYGAHVLVEKPPTLTLRQFAELSAAAQHSGRHVATVFQHRFGSGARRLRSLYQSGVLGRALLALCQTTWYRPQEYFDVPWRGRWDTEGGGPTMGHGIHQMDLLLAVLGDWTRVSALARRQARDVDTEDLSLAHVSFADGAVASVVNSVLSPREQSYLRFDFTHATVELTHLYGYGEDAWRVTAAPGYEEAVLGAWHGGERGVPSGHRAQFAAVLDALEAGERPPVTLSEARRTMELVAAIYASSFTGHPVDPDDVAPGSPFYEQMQGGGPPWRIVARQEVA
ncbi:oxidoreductase [Asanoa ishikariensis]|uniref:Predicted dehydrogenase n=1 Tax=Asanoa ishikariensis TaxID=137265 RepID=A0A1H3S8Z4_9ACTN|nr:Gfo/Idh/MocA family oxidoreductase [Asanoa ishikariensis]GIF70301.1 oxidoreductase [Asanoa ishikariensis]SDZ34227.1 Predicted dehydrogenase [Asanoa ishikariensis]